MKHIAGNTTRTFLAVFISFLMIISGGLFSAEASDSKATFTVQ